MRICQEISSHKAFQSHQIVHFRSLLGQLTVADNLELVDCVFADHLKQYVPQLILMIFFPNN